MSTRRLHTQLPVHAGRLLLEYNELTRGFTASAKHPPEGLSTQEASP
jgi:hypothetical protein